jgi:ABC-type Fe3+ transport system permease subunit
MIGDLLKLAGEQARASIRGAATPAIFILVAAGFALVGGAALFIALFFWLAPAYGPVVATLAVAGLAFVLALAAALPVLFRKRRAPPPAPPLPDVLPTLIAALPEVARALGPRTLAVGAIVAALVLGFAARSSDDKKQD